jgi:hypothetical protein
LDRLFWIALRRLWPGWKNVLIIVKPDTVVAWHRAGFRWYWRWRSRRLPCRPKVTKELRDLILSFAKTRPDAVVTLRRVHNGREDLRVVGSE